ncbi:MAG TPA: chromosomal replication initiator protein DnaA [Ruminococcaceae bacterium]|nr:chromosomal replication initiator protein DnaA [Oscillospiraceae bacterium]
MVYCSRIWGNSANSKKTYYANLDYHPFEKKSGLAIELENHMDLVYELWENVKREIKANTSETIYSVWFEPLKLESFDGQTVRLTDDPFRCKIINQKFIPLLEDSFEKIMGFRLTVVVEPVQEKPKKQEIAITDIGESGEYTFDNFIVGDSNKFAHAAAKAVAADPGNTYNPLFIHGNSGLGKTHLLNAICSEIKKNNPDAYMIYVRSEDFMNELIEYLQNKRDTSVFHNKYRNADVLLVDDVQFIAGKTSTELEFFHTFDTLVKAKRQIVLTSDRPPKEMATLEERLRNRFESGLIADIQPPDLETRIAIIKSKAKSLNINLPDPICMFIADKIKSNIRQLEGSVRNMQALMELHGAEANMSTAQLAIRDIFNESDPIPVLIDKILDEVSRTYGVSVADIKSRRHDAKFTTPRHIAMYVMREITDLTNQKIADYFGLNDHTSVLYAVRKVKSEREKNYTTKTIISDIIKNVQSNS